MQLPLGEAKWIDRPEKPAPASGLWFPFLPQKFILQPREEVVCVSVTQSCPTLCDPMNCSLPSSSLHGIIQDILQECRCQGHVVCSPAFGSSPARDRDLLPHSVVPFGSTADSIFLVRYQLLRKSRQYLPVSPHPVGRKGLLSHGDTGPRTLSAEFPPVELESRA